VETGTESSARCRDDEQRDRGLAKTFGMDAERPFAHGSEHEVPDVGRIRIDVDPGGKVIEAANADGGCGDRSPGEDRDGAANAQ
jgi:hypothetical protein